MDPVPTNATGTGPLDPGAGGIDRGGDDAGLSAIGLISHLA
ncbi:MAG: hypothetical protein ABI332_15135 [Polyangiaceae bacterium]